MSSMGQESFVGIHQMLRFAWIWMLLAFPLPLIVRFALPKYTQKEASMKVPFFQEVSHQFLKAQTKSIVWIGFAILAWIALILAAARPQWIDETVNVPVTGRDLLVALDISGSMRQMDFSVSNVSRFEAVRYIAGNFLKRRAGDRVGLILFGSKPYLYAPLTFDVETLVEFLKGSKVGFAGQRTAIGDTIGFAVKVLRERPAENRILILLTDGENSAGSLEPLQALQLALQHGIRIFVIGIGPSYGLSSAEQSASRSRHDLEQIAELTGGLFFHASNPQMLEEVYHKIDQYEPIEGDETTRTSVSELYPWLLGFSMLLLTALILRSNLPSLNSISVPNFRNNARTT